MKTTNRLHKLLLFIIVLFCSFVKHLGSGQFGSVSEGIWETEAQNTAVALKVLKEGYSKTDKLKFLQEAVIMVQFRHPNVVAMFGMVTEGEPVSELQ